MVRPTAPVPKFKPRPARAPSPAPVSNKASETPAPSGPVSSLAPKKAFTPTSPYAGTGVTPDTNISPWIVKHPLCQGLDNTSLIRIRNIIAVMNVRDSKKVLDYGDELRTKFADMIDTIVDLSQHNGIPPELYSDMEEVLTHIKSADVNTVFQTEPIAWWDILRRRATLQQRKSQLSPTHHSGRITRAVGEVELLMLDVVDSVRWMVERIDSLDRLYHENYDNFKLLNLYVIAGKLIIDNETNRVIPEMEKRLDTKDLFQMQDFLYYKECVKRFAKKVEDLEITAHTMTLKAGQIRQMQSNAHVTADNITKLAKNTIPQWRMQSMALAQKLQTNRFSKLVDIEAELRQQSGFMDGLIALQNEVTAKLTK